MTEPETNPQSVTLPTASGFTQTTPVPLYWVSYGQPHSGRMLVLHGGPGAHHDYLLPQMLALAKRHEVLFYDQRGGGKSLDDSRDLVTWESHVDDLSSVVAELQLEPLTLVGYSWGGLLALLYSLRARSRAGTPGASPMPTRMILIDPAPAVWTHRKTMEAELKRRQDSAEVHALRADLAASGLRESDPDAYRRRLFELSVRGYFSDPDAAGQLTSFRVTGRIQQSVWGSLGEYDVLQDLRALQVPSLVIHGRDDPIPLESSEGIAEALGARLLVLDGSGHVPYVERPRELFSAIERFLETYPGK